MTGIKYEEQGRKLLNEKLIPMFQNYKDTFDMLF